MEGRSTPSVAPASDPNGAGAALSIVDAHQHFWNPTLHYYPWLCDEPPIAFRYAHGEILTEAGPAPALIRAGHLPRNHPRLARRFPRPPRPPSRSFLTPIASPAPHARSVHQRPHHPAHPSSAGHVFHVAPGPRRRHRPRTNGLHPPRGHRRPPPPRRMGRSSSTVPSNTTSPPSVPAPGPRSTT